MGRFAKYKCTIEELKALTSDIQSLVKPALKDVGSAFKALYNLKYVDESDIKFIGAPLERYEKISRFDLEFPVMWMVDSNVDGVLAPICVYIDDKGKLRFFAPIKKGKGAEKYDADNLREIVEDRINVKVKKEEVIPISYARCGKTIDDLRSLIDHAGGMWELFKKVGSLHDGLNRIDVSTENLDSGAAFSHSLECEDYEVIGGIPFAWGMCGGDWEQPIAFVVYFGGDGSLKSYVPSSGNAYNHDELCAYGSEANPESDVDHSDDFDYDKMVEDIKSHIKLFDETKDEIDIETVFEPDEDEWELSADAFVTNESELNNLIENGMKNHKYNESDEWADKYGISYDDILDAAEKKFGGFKFGETRFGTINGIPVKWCEALPEKENAFVPFWFVLFADVNYDDEACVAVPWHGNPIDRIAFTPSKGTDEKVDFSKMEEEMKKRLKVYKRRVSNPQIALFF